MKELIKICTVNPDNTLTVIDEKNLTVTLDESRMKVTVIYKKQTYDVQGNFQFQYIEIPH